MLRCVLRIADLTFSPSVGSDAVFVSAERLPLLSPPPPPPPSFSFCPPPSSSLLDPPESSSAASAVDVSALSEFPEMNERSKKRRTFGENAEILNRGLETCRVDSHVSLYSCRRATEAEVE